MRGSRLRRSGLLTLLFCLYAAAPARAQQKPAVTPEDYGKFENLGFGGGLSPDGKWLAVPIARVNDENELRIHQVASDSVVIVPNGQQVAFSRDGRWAAWIIGHSGKELQAAEKTHQTLHAKLGLMNLATGQLEMVNEIASFSFSGDGRFLAMRGYMGKDQKNKGVDLIVRDLATGTNTSFGDADEYGWQDQGHQLAFTIDAGTRAGNGVKLYDPSSGVLRSLDSDTAGYSSLTWRPKSADLAVLRVHNDSTRQDPGYVVLAWTGLGSPKPAAYTMDPARQAGFPPDMRVVDYRGLDWAKDGNTLLFGIKEWLPKEKPDSASKNEDSDKPGVEIWHAKDVDIMPEQKLSATRDRQRNFLSAWHPQSGRFVQVANDLTEDATPARAGDRALAMDATPYEREKMFAPDYRDLYVVDMNTGERTEVKKRVQFPMGISPSGRYLLYLDQGAYQVYDAVKKTTTNITGSIRTSFVNTDDDHTVSEKPPYGTGGWTTGEAGVLLYDKFDIWEVSPDGSKATRLTDGAADQVRSRMVYLDLDEDYRDLSKPNYVALYGERTKKFGYGTVQRGKPEQRLVYVDHNVSRLAKAKDAPVFAYTIMDFDDSPDFFVGSPALTDAHQVTHTNVFQADYAWGHAQLVDFNNAEGKPLQASLYYPANYDPAKKYPMIVYIYEITSNTVHNWTAPSERNPYDPSVWTAEGYFVLQPDIVYRDRNPGLSAVDCILPAVDRIASMGLIDPKKVGLVGHSWGGYQTAFVGTVTDKFAAAVAGAPLTELASMYLSIYWNSGGTNARIFEISQGRMEVPPWQDPTDYMKNSAVWNIEKMTTPMLVTFGDKDGAVDWHQGIEMYNAARRADKELVLLVYEGENHGLAKKANQIDYHRRVMAWFNHYLRGDPAPDWMTKGVKFLDRDKEIKRAITTKPISDGSRHN